MLAFDMTLTKLPQSASEAIQRKAGAALLVYTGVRLVSRIDLVNDTFVEPAPENVFQEAMAADWDEQSAATTRTTTSPTSKMTRTTTLKTSMTKTRTRRMTSTTKTTTMT